MNDQSYDIIGDIHGQHDKLVSLLRKLGYSPRHGTWKHPEGRKAIFLGDYIDRGPRIREVLHTVRGMCDAGDALAIMGNHEYNAVCYATPDGAGAFLKEHSKRNARTHGATLAQFADKQEEWHEWIEWMKRLPFALDLGALRCVHACWDEAGLHILKGRSLADDVLLRSSVREGTAEHRAISHLLKGPEMPATAGNMFHDKEGTCRDTIRVRWWNLRTGLTIGDIAMPPGSIEDNSPVSETQLRQVPHYALDQPPVFFGHYWLPADTPKDSLANNIACLDFSGGLDGPLVAYRWDGGVPLQAGRFVTTSDVCPFTFGNETPACFRPDFPPGNKDKRSVVTKPNLYGQECATAQKEGRLSEYLQEVAATISGRGSDSSTAT